MALFDRFKKKAEGAPDTAEAPADAGGQAPAATNDVASPADDAPAGDPGAASPVEPPAEGEYRKVRVNPGKRGWGNGLVIAPEPGKDLIYSVTGGGIHPVAQRIADMTGGKTFDGFKSKADFKEIACAVIDCGGTARIGVYPMKGVLTVDIHGASPSGPLMRFITEENFVSGTGVDDIELVD
jgi:glucitol/sorbitol PTS system EIIB component